MSDACGCGSDEPRTGEQAEEHAPERLWQVTELRAAAVAGLLLVVGFVFGMLNTYLRDREISQHLTNLARQVAVRDAELARREEELTELLRRNAREPGADDTGAPAPTNGTQPSREHETTP